MAHGDELYEFLSREITSRITNRFGEEARSVAAEIANEVCDELIGEWGGASLYVPRHVFANFSVRNKAIFDDYKGGNTRELEKKYRLSGMRIRQIIKAMTAEKRRQSRSISAEEK
jgi:Mor family transcriptional regulator